METQDQSGASLPGSPGSAVFVFRARDCHGLWGDMRTTAHSEAEALTQVKSELRRIAEEGSDLNMPSLELERVYPPNAKLIDDAT